MSFAAWALISAVNYQNVTCKLTSKQMLYFWSDPCLLSRNNVNCTQIIQKRSNNIPYTFFHLIQHNNFLYIRDCLITNLKVDVLKQIFNRETFACEGVWTRYLPLIGSHIWWSSSALGTLIATETPGKQDL